ncbi:Zinc finger family protein / BRCT domain-containing protein, putative isoform 1 [Hibiscus syriacus]|uniref:Sulfotransferase n=1 Tax=Hibiscus syriacus TaxID=106335 RepID=A0A6A2XZP3_HIBSY|nr:Zinc finger family protein / BRCT domain-containing protein, putative isoform 1 [Hibiscus syriacus]
MIQHGSDAYNWEGFWYRAHHLSAAMAARSSFQANDSDVFLASSMKTSTTWLKAIIPTIMNPYEDDPLLNHHPNELMPSLKIQIFKVNRNPNLSDMPPPRLFRTHVPYPMLYESIKSSACKIVYISRDPKDTFTSCCHFMNSVIADRGIDPWPMDEAFESFCRGIHAFGPFHDHVLGYWKESIKRPEKIHFMRYEDMKNEPKEQLRKLACFLQRPFHKEEEVDKVLWRCSLERLKSLEVNQHGVDPWVGINYKHYFRSGTVGDWKNQFTDEMKEKLDRITTLKF